MMNAFFLSLGQLFQRRILGILIRVVAISLSFFAGLGILLYFSLEYGLQRYGMGEGGAITAFVSAIIAIFAGWLLFRAIAIVVLNVFADEIVDAVEEKHYSARRATAQPPRLLASLKIGLKSAGRLLGYNLIALPVYIMLAITSVGTAVAFLLVNGLLLGRDLEDMVAARHNDPRSGVSWQLPKLVRLLLGVAVTLLFMVPIANLLAPILGAAMATHLLHRHMDRSI